LNIILHLLLLDENDVGYWFSIHITESDPVIISHYKVSNPMGLSLGDFLIKEFGCAQKGFSALFFVVEFVVIVQYRTNCLV